jgi:hypothetical protein
MANRNRVSIFYCRFLLAAYEVEFRAISEPSAFHQHFIRHRDFSRRYSFEPEGRAAQSSLSGGRSGVAADIQVYAIWSNE